MQQRETCVYNNIFDYWNKYYKPVLMGAGNIFDSSWYFLRIYQISSV